MGSLLSYKRIARMIVDERGLPDRLLSGFVRLLLHTYSEETVRAYVRLLLAWIAAWSEEDEGRTWTSILSEEPRVIRNHITAFLESTSSCAIYRKSSGECGSYKLIRSHRNQPQIRALLSVLKIFFEFLIDASAYHCENPMRANVNLMARAKQEVRKEFLAHHGRMRMSSESGVDPPVFTRQTDNYFRVVESEWIPCPIDDSNLAIDSLAAGVNAGWGEREILIATLLFETGARISEICAMTLGGWAKAGLMNACMVINKGSNKIESKLIYFSESSASRLRKHFDNIARRGGYSKGALGIPTWSKIMSEYVSRERDLPELLASTRLFVTKNGAPYKPDVFRRLYWVPALASIGVKVQPHAIRHWFVTQAVNRIGEEPDESRRLEEMRRFVVYMGWRTGEQMIERYSHGLRIKKPPDVLIELQKTVCGAVQGRAPTAERRPCPDVLPVDSDLLFVLGAKLNRNFQK